MFLILPNRPDGLNNLIGKLESTTLQRVAYLMDRVQVQVRLPKFKFDNEFVFNDILREVFIFFNIFMDFFFS